MRISAVSTLDKVSTLALTCISTRYTRQFPGQGGRHPTRMKALAKKLQKGQALLQLLHLCRRPPPASSVDGRALGRRYPGCPCHLEGLPCLLYTSDAADE